MIMAVTGASGFIGSHLTAELAARGHRVRAISRRPRPCSESNLITAARADYEDADALARALTDVDVVFHAAGATRGPTREALRAANERLTRRVLGALSRGANPPRFVYLSSLAAAGPATSPQSPLNEDDPPTPVEGYGLAKLGAERAVLEAAHIASTIVRPAAVYGARDRDFLELFRLARRGIALHAANRDHVISIVHVRDAVDAIIRAALEPTAVGRVYFVANDEPAQWGQLFRLGASAAGRQLRVDLELPSVLVDVGARIGDFCARVTGNATLLTTEKVALGKRRYWLCSSARAKRELGFRAATTLEDGFAETYRWYREHRWL